MKLDGMSAARIAAVLNERGVLSPLQYKKDRGLPHPRKADIDGTSLINKKGDSGEVKIGMVCEARIITKSRKIIYWVLEKLNFFNQKYKIILTNLQNSI
jgi:hypothetical protein